MKILMPLIAVALTACGPSKSVDTVDSLVANPERIQEIRRLCTEDRAKVNDEICVAAAQAAKRRFYGERPEQKAQ
ncbi:EexN family lipoprotein [Diaphorobacter caeni]|uniref:EexN family lipoprotein n=1 Tax=Diaphorobacter caeni TaxID=2784387 RepID=UPI00188E2E63|nr:EexN family lipoprotein [Diaphorobacter caeni]MBF5007142.1 EexN family lipoprotein [Diaphorobacter caeni]